MYSSASFLDQRVCQFFLRGRCQRENCEFRHDAKAKEAADNKAAAVAAARAALAAANVPIADPAAIGAKSVRQKIRYAEIGRSNLCGPPRSFGTKTQFVRPKRMDESNGSSAAATKGEKAAGEQEVGKDAETSKKPLLPGGPSKRTSDWDDDSVLPGNDDDDDESQVSGFTEINPIVKRQQEKASQKEKSSMLAQPTSAVKHDTAPKHKEFELEKETRKESTKETSKEISKDSAADPNMEPAAEPAKEPVKEQTKEQAKEQAKEAVEEPAKAIDSNAPEYDTAPSEATTVEATQIQTGEGSTSPKKSPDQKKEKDKGAKVTTSCEVTTTAASPPVVAKKSAPSAVAKPPKRDIRDMKDFDKYFR